MDEFEYWQEMSKSGGKIEMKERAENFVELFKPISKDYGGLDSMSLNDAMELVELTQDTLDDVWKQTDFDPYSENRMKHLMDVIGENRKSINCRRALNAMILFQFLLIASIVNSNGQRYCIFPCFRFPSSKYILQCNNSIV